MFHPNPSLLKLFHLLFSNPNGTMISDSTAQSNSTFFVYKFPSEKKERPKKKKNQTSSRYQQTGKKKKKKRLHCAPCETPSALLAQYYWIENGPL